MASFCSSVNSCQAIGSSGFSWARKYASISLLLVDPKLSVSRLDSPSSCQIGTGWNFSILANCKKTAWVILSFG